MVGRGKLTPNYFFDEASFSELNEIMEATALSERAEWERTRMQMYITAQVQSSERLKPTDILSFQWDKDNESEEQEDKENEQEKLNEIREKMKRWQAVSI